MSDYGLTVASLAKGLGISRQTVNEVLREKRSITPAMALKLSKLFGNSPEFWLNAQRAVDLWEANRRYQEQIRRIKRILPQHAA